MSSRSKPRVLLVEDEEAIRTAVDQALRQLGCEVRALGDGWRVIDVTAAFRPDLAILDVRLPEGPDGYTIARRLRSGSDFPLLFLTAADSHEDRRSGFQAGADDYLVKPFSMEELLWRVKALLRRSGRLESPTFQIGDLVLDEGAKTVARATPRTGEGKTMKAASATGLVKALGGVAMALCVLLATAGPAVAQSTTPPSAPPPAPNFPAEPPPDSGGSPDPGPAPPSGGGSNVAPPAQRSAPASGATRRTATTAARRTVSGSSTGSSPAVAPAPPPPPEAPLAQPPAPGLPSTGLAPEPIQQAAEDDGGGFPWWLLVLLALAIGLGVLAWFWRKRIRDRIGPERLGDESSGLGRLFARSGSR